ncbi:RNA polymerase factor sigma-54 [Treponema zioleckii]|uniref:RNA polymerase factor sigma-54 n=1 Tax=Treponema zioleckii TaxID=331680 RepID=UPI00168BA3C2|nr:RNA polymerase factor sigma-54 [Treponema zioleckii]
MPQMKFQQNTTQAQKMNQSQRMNQTQIQSLNLLSMNSADLREEIYSFAEKNPALEIIDDEYENGITTATVHTNFSDLMHYGRPGKEGDLASDNFQQALENQTDTRETLSEHLLLQLNSMKLNENEYTLGEKLINNLDQNGFHILAPYSFLDKKNPEHNEILLKKVIELIQRLDPLGTCCRNFEESLFVQAKIRHEAGEKVPEEALFILDGHFDSLNPPQPAKIAKKLNNFVDEQKKLSFIGRNTNLPENPFTEEGIEKALAFIKTLDPKPARNFGVSSENLVRTDVFVEREKNPKDGESEFKIRLSNESLPKIQISKDFTELEKSLKVSDSETGESAERRKSQKRYLRDSINNAKIFIDSINFRESTILKATEEIVRIQADFFRGGPRFLVPLRQKDIAQTLGVHEATISRMANEKYLSCDWGIFQFSYFFTTAVGKSANSDENQENKNDEKPTKSFEGTTSKEGVKFEIKNLLEKHKNDSKQLSDQKIADILAGMGIKLSRRTVAKYRSELNINSSYER